MDLAEYVRSQALAKLRHGRLSHEQLNDVLRLFAKYRSQLIQNTLLKLHGARVLAGPFAGMEFVNNSSEGCHVAKLLGCYEGELHQIVETIVSEGHSRIPVFDGNIDNVVGILYAKDLLPFLVGEDRPPTIRHLLRTPLYVPGSMLVDDLLHSLQRRKVHIAIVLDEHGGTAGLVTIEDLIEEIVGEIQDEYDEEEPLIVTLGEDEVRVDGRADVDDLMERFGTSFGGEDSEEFDTVGGLVYHYIGGVPHVGDTVEVDGLRLTVEATDGRRVRTVHVSRTVSPAVATEAESDAP